MTALRHWWHTRAWLETALDDAHHALTSQQRRISRDAYEIEALAGELERVRDDLRLLRKVLDCPGPREHVVLAHRLEQAEALLGEALGENPHRHSLGETA